MTSATPLTPIAGAPSRTVGGELLRADGLAVGYRDGPTVLEHVSFSLRAGERIGVLGPNGGGKTTLFRAVCGELAPRSGSLRSPERCGVVPQTDRSRLDFPISALDVALMGALDPRCWWRRPGRADREAARRALDSVGLPHLAAASFGSLSGGQRQRVLIARALVQDAPVIVLDEPFTGLDTDSTARLQHVLDRLAAEGRGLLIATHDVSQARDLERVLCLNRRQVAFGTPDEMLTTDVLADTYASATA